MLEAGDALGYVELPGMQFGAPVCYGLRFPELYALMAPHGHGAVCIANWSAGRVLHWRSLLVAKVIESQMFMFGVNRVGVNGNDLHYEYSSMAVAPNGEVIMPTYSSPELDIVEVDPSDALRYRDDFPTVRDKRCLLYRELLGQKA